LEKSTKYKVEINKIKAKTAYQKLACPKTLISRYINIYSKGFITKKKTRIEDMAWDIAWK
jgi:hypothetical protein